MTDLPESSGATPFQFTIEEPETWQRIVKVEIPRSYFDKQYAGRLSKAVKGHQRPGFRKGKTPRTIVESEQGDSLRAQTFEALVPRVYQAAVIEHRLFPLNDPNLENLVFEEDKPITFDLSFEVRPTVEASDYDNLPVRQRALAVTDDEVDQVLQRLGESRAIWDKVDRPAAADDQITLNVTPYEDDGSLDAEKTVENQKLVLGAENNLPVFNEGLDGVEAEQERDLEVSYPDDYPAEHLRGRTVRFHCLIKAVHKQIVPEIDDAFASQLEEGQTLLELRGNIRQQLSKEAEARISREMDEQIVDELIKRHEVEVPPSLVADYLKSSLEELHARNLQTGRPNNEDEDERFRELTRPVAERVLKGMFIMEAIRRAEDLAVADEDVESRIVEIAAEHGFDLEKYREYIDQADERNKIRHGLDERKTLDFLLSRAEVTPVAADADLEENHEANRAANHEGNAADVPREDQAGGG